MDTNKLKKFAQLARRQLRDLVSAKLEHVLKIDSVEYREKQGAIKDLQDRVAKSSKEQVIDHVAYTWFNRFCALRFMDIKRYTFIGTVSPAAGYTQPEILAEAKQGNIDASIELYLDRKKVFDLLSGITPSLDSQTEVYRILLVAICNYYHSAMPFLFERINDYTELLMPDDLLSENSLLAEVREALSNDSCRDVEVIGWLYQFYISEKKDEIFEGLKKNKKITPENIPAATQLFTPSWIVRYLVDNSLGRLWLLNNPQSRLVDRLEYYIKPEEPETDFLKVSQPEDLRICDSACGSGHMLVYAFDLLYAIYEEEGYDQAEIPALILKNNLYGVEIDLRAGELAAFALVMKAQEKYHRFMNKPIQPNICVLENIDLKEDELAVLNNTLGPDLFTADLKTTLKQFTEADNFGSLICPKLTDLSAIRSKLGEIDPRGDFILYQAKEKATIALRQADYLSPKYHVVIANPPYMGGKGMNDRLGSWLKNHYSDVKSDLFSAFIIRNTNLVLNRGQLGFMSPFVWMFISSHEKLRNYLIGKKTITSLIQLEYSGFDGATVPICTFTVENTHRPDFKGSYVRLSDFRGSNNQGPKTLEAIKNPNCGWFFKASATDFKKIPGSPIAYWVAKRVFEVFSTHPSLESVSKPRQGATTSDNNRFLRLWHEVEFSQIAQNCTSLEIAQTSGSKWFPYNKGGEFRRWYGNHEFIINYLNNGKEIKEFHEVLNLTKPGGRLKNQSYYFKPSVSWSKISSSTFAVRYFPEGFIFDVAGSAIFFDQDRESIFFTGLLNSNVVKYILQALSPTLNFEAEHLCKIPILEKYNELDDQFYENVSTLIKLSKNDWNSNETSWSFETSPFFMVECQNGCLKSRIRSLFKYWEDNIGVMKRLEEQNNTILTKTYSLQNELSLEVKKEEITLTCNPHYRYRGDKTEEGFQAMQLADTMRDFISYSVGCMFGRYSIDEQGLILANQEETVVDFLKKIPNPSYKPEENNVIPIMDEEWFGNDLTERFKQFLRISFGEDYYTSNLAFIEEAIGKDIRKFFLKDFYNDHIRRYKKRPIYWLFSSSKSSFNALIYMHRYQPDTVSVVLNEYLREYRTKLTAHWEYLEQVSISPSASKQEKTRVIKEIEKLKKIITELNDYEREILYPLATEKVEIDLDDGVKVNYNKFGKALKKVPGLSN